MPRLPRVRGLPSLHQVAAAPSSSSAAAAARAPFAASVASSSSRRSVSTTAPLAGTNTDWVRGKLWKGEAPGPEDPYTQRPEPEDPSNLPEEAQHLSRGGGRDNRPYAVQNTRLVLPPKRTEATAEKELESLDAAYTPATSIEGLEAITPVGQWWNMPGHWGEESKFKGFALARQVQDKALLQLSMRRAVVEALALQKEGLLESWVSKKWRVGERQQLNDVLAVVLEVQDGKATLSGSVSTVTQNLTGEAEGAVTLPEISADELALVIQGWNSDWESIALDEQLKFAIRKRIYQLTGRLIPDAKLAAARTVSHVITLTVSPVIKNSTKKLAEIIKAKGDLAELPNVTVHSKKVGVIDKEKAIGRWKVIEEELKRRDLPVTGTAGLARSKEREWLSGRA